MEMFFSVYYCTLGLIQVRVKVSHYSSCTLVAQYWRRTGHCPGSPGALSLCFYIRHRKDENSIRICSEWHTAGEDRQEGGWGRKKGQDDKVAVK